ncbi:MAG: hypothetical protein ACK5LS_03845 [Propioniciclava sp.]
MMTQTAEALEALRRLVRDAKAVPMSASCMVNRSEALALMDQLADSIATETAAADSVTADRDRQLTGAREQAARIVDEARLLAEEMVRETPVHTEAVERAEALAQEATEEAEEIRREADSYVDARIAELEAGLARTMSQIQTMRARLAERSHLDDRFGQGD